MNICLDISQIVHEGTGVARFIDGLVRAILEYDTKNQWIFFFSSLRKNLEENLEKKIITKGHKLIKLKIPPTFLSFLSNDLHNPYLSSIIHHPSSNIDWFISSDWTEPSFPRVKKATIIHDLVYLRYPKTVDARIRQTQQKRLQWVKKESNLIFADSHSTKEDLINLLNIEPHRMIVNYPGVSILDTNASQIHRTLKKYGLKNKQFILTVGKLEPRKNLSRLMEAMKLVKSKRLQLIVVGPTGWDNSLTRELVNSNNKIMFFGYVSDEDLYSLYSSCLFFIFPSIWEGFGYPIIEAMKCGAPVACSNTSSIKEIAGDAALFFDPLDVSNMYQSIDRLIHDEKLRKELVKKGLQRSKLFSWKNYYNKLIQALEQYDE